MSALHSFSFKLGKAIGLPPIFYRPIQLPKLLEESLNSLTLTLAARRRAQRAAAVRQRQERARASVSDRPVVLEGLVRTGGGTKYSIDGTDFTVTSGTWIIGELRLGSSARVKGIMNIDGKLEASSIVMLDNA